MHWYVRDLERSRQFYTELLDFAELASRRPSCEAQGRQKSACFQAGKVHAGVLRAGR